MEEEADRKTDMGKKETLIYSWSLGFAFVSIFTLNQTRQLCNLNPRDGIIPFHQRKSKVKTSGFLQPRQETEKGKRVQEPLSAVGGNKTVGTGPEARNPRFP